MRLWVTSNGLDLRRSPIVSIGLPNHIAGLQMAKRATLQASLDRGIYIPGFPCRIRKQADTNKLRQFQCSASIPMLNRR